MPRPTALPPSRYDLTREDLAARLDGQPAYRVRQVWDGLHRRLATPAEMTDLPAPLRGELEASLPWALAPAEEQVSDGGDTVKWLWSLRDGARVESVLLHYPDRVTVCVSSQAGCAMACGFCATGQMGFERQLSAGEIVEQVVRAARRARPRRLGNVVFMGMGEPLANYRAVHTAVRRLHDDLGLSARHVTVSTVGVAPGIRRLAADAVPAELAVSLHAADDDLRDRLVPLNRRYPLEEVVTACEEWRAARGRRVSLEWALIDGVNDGPTDAAGLARIASRLRAHVNLIPLNPTPGFPTRGSPASGVEAFRRWLAERGVGVTVRRTRGRDIDAACGQLAAPDGAAGTCTTPAGDTPAAGTRLDAPRLNAPGR